MVEPLGAAAQEVKDMIERLSKASGQLSKSEIRDIERCAEVGKRVLDSGIQALVNEAAGSPMLRTSSADGTPVQCHRTATYKLPSGAKFQRSGKETSELLLFNSFYRFIDYTGKTMTKALVEEPTPLNWGKRAENIFDVCRRRFMSLRECGHRGIAVEHFCFDRAAHSALAKLVGKWAKVTSQRAGLTAEGKEPTKYSIHNLTLWIADTPCAAHDAQNSFRWSLWQVDFTGDTLKDAHICIESLRNSINLLQGHVGNFVAKNVHYVADQSIHTQDEMRAVWDALGVEPEVAELLSGTLQLRYNNSSHRLEVAESAKDLPDLMGTIIACLMSMWKFKQFTDSRWLTVGDSGRTVTIGLLTGLRKLVNDIKKVPHVSLYHLNGFDRLVGDVQRFLVEASIVSRPMDAVLALLMEDSRVAQRYEELDSAIREEMDWMLNLPDKLWELLGELVSESPGKLRSRCLQAGSESAAQFTKRCLNVAAQRPWSLCRGDIEANVDMLAAENEAPTSDEISHHIWHLCRIGFNKTQIVKGVMLLGNVPWATIPTEQFHASAAALMRVHPEYTQSTLRCRAFVLTLNRLMPRPTEDEKSIATLQRRLATLQRKQPHKASGRHMYLRDIIDLAKEKHGKQLAATPNWQKRIVKNHGPIWAAHSLARRQPYERRAVGYQEETQDN